MAVIGTITLSPISDFLPVGFWASLKNNFQGKCSQFMRVVAVENISFIIYILIGVGIVLVILSYFVKANE